MNVVLQLTEACNLRCRYCYFPQKSYEQMNESTVFQAIDFFAEKAMQRHDPHLCFTFFGGEPLLCPDLIYAGDEYVRSKYGAHFRIKNGINTNGTLLDHTMGHYLSTRGFRVYYSVDGVEASHNTHRIFANGKGSWDSVIQHLDYVDPLVVAMVRVVTPQTMYTLVDDSKLFLQKGVKTHLFAVDWNAGWTPVLLDELEVLYRQLAEFHKQECEQARPFYVNILGDKLRLGLSGQSCKNTSCHVGKTVFSVNPRGDIFPCTRFLSTTDFTWKLGDLQQGFSPLALDTIKQYHQNDREFCDSCTIKNRCLANGCACTSYSTIGGLFGDPSPFVCAHERMVCRLLDELYG